MDPEIQISRGPSTMLPVEILEYIFSCLDVNSLKASSKVHTLFSRVAERHLYTDIALQNSEKLKCSDYQLPLEVGQLSNVLSERPHIANYVLSLVINAGSNNELLFPFLEAVPSILALLPKLKMIRLNCPTGWAEFNKYPNLPESFRLSLAKSFGLLSMKEVEFYGIKVPLSLLHRCGNTIERLVFDHCIVPKPDDSEVESSSSDCPPLKNLSITELDNQSLKTLVHWVANGCRQLRQFRFSPFDKKDDEPFILIKPILESCSNTLTVLDIDLASLCKLDSTRLIFSQN